MQTKRHILARALTLCALVGAFAVQSVQAQGLQAQRMSVPEAMRSGAAEAIAEITPAREVDMGDKLQLERLLKPSSAATYKQLGEAVTGELEEMGRRLVTLEVPAGEAGEVVLLATCGENCGDLDIFVYNSAGDLLGYDDYDDALPALSLRGLRAGDTLTAEVVMYDCLNEACEYTLAFFGKL